MAVRIMFPGGGLRLCTQDILLARRAVSFYSEHVGTQDGGFYGGFYSGHVGTQDGTLGLLIG